MNIILWISGMPKNPLRLEILNLIAPIDSSPEWKERVLKYGLVLALQDWIRAGVPATYYPLIFDYFWNIVGPRLFGFQKYVGIAHENWTGFIWSTCAVQEDWQSKNGILSKRIGKYPKLAISI